MTNALVGDVYQKVIEEVVAASTNDFEESGVGQATLNDLQEEWKRQLSAKRVASMPWEPKPVPVQPPAHVPPPIQPASSNGMPANPYSGQYESGMSNGAPAHINGDHRVKPESSEPQQYNGLPQSNPYPQVGSGQGGMARAQQLVEQQFGAQAAASIQRGGLALPGQQKPPQGLQMPAQNQHQQQQYATQQHQQAQQALRQQQQLQQQQHHPRVKVENNSPVVQQGQFQQQHQQHQKPPRAGYGQTDGAEEAMEEWKAMLAQRRAAAAESMMYADHMMRDQILAQADETSNGLMMPLGPHKSRLQKRKRTIANQQKGVSTAPPAGPSSIAQFDGQLDVKDDDKKGRSLRDEDDDEDVDAINSDLDDPDDELNAVDNDDDDGGDSILCTYDKVQRVKNKWKCTLKDGVLSTGGKEWIFHKGMGEFEW